MVEVEQTNDGNRNPYVLRVGVIAAEARTQAGVTGTKPATMPWRRSSRVREDMAETGHKREEDHAWEVIVLT